MRGLILVRSFALVVAVVFAATQAAAQAQSPQARRVAPAALVLPVAGTFEGGTFTGRLSVQRFAARGDQVVAVGMIAGTLVRQDGAPAGTFLNGPVEIPVTVRQGEAGAVPGAGTGPLTEAEPAQSQRPPVQAEPPARQRPLNEVEPPAAPGDAMLAQQEMCGVLHLEFLAITLNVLGLAVTLSPVTLDISGDTGGVLGALVCQILGSLGDVANLPGLLNPLLGLLGGLTGGLPA
jgi:hypothetical protein